MSTFSWKVAKEVLNLIGLFFLFVFVIFVVIALLLATATPFLAIGIAIQRQRRLKVRRLKIQLPIPIPPRKKLQKKLNLFCSIITIYISVISIDTGAICKERKGTPGKTRERWEGGYRSTFLLNCDVDPKQIRGGGAKEKGITAKHLPSDTRL